jgi:predicted dehydrogenase
MASSEPAYERLGAKVLSLPDVIAQSLGFIGPVFSSAFVIPLVIGVISPTISAPWLALALLVVGFASTFVLRARQSASSQLTDLNAGSRVCPTPGAFPARPRVACVTSPVAAARRPGELLRVGILGAGMIATVEPGYLPGLRRLCGRVEVTAIASRTRSRAERVARDWDIPAVYDGLSQMLAAPGIDAVVNLTPIAAHYQTSREIVSAGKHLVTEKPLASTLEAADELIETAERGGLLIVCAPMDILKREWAQARRLIREGAIGKVAFARVHSSHGGPAAMAWPADPTWFYAKGAGPLLDMGVYGLDRITAVLGPARSVAAMSGVTAPVRRARGGPFDGLEIPVTENDNTLLLLDFGDATFCVVDATFCAMASRSPEMEVFGLAGTLVVNRPDASYGPGELPVELFRVDAAPGLPGWITPHSLDAETRPDRTRILARASLVEHLADCLDSGTQPLPSATRARHVLEIMLAARTAAATGRTVPLTTTFTQEP